VTVTRPTIFVIDNDASVRERLARLFASIRFTAEVFSSAEAFLKRKPYDGVGCIILDTDLPGLSGLDLQEELNKSRYPMPVIFITGQGTIRTCAQAMKAGAFDFLPEPFDEDELVAAVKGAVEKDRAARTVRSAVRGIRGRMKRLTPKEYEVLRCMIGGMRNRPIAVKLGIVEKTVKIHRSRVFTKLDAGSLAELARMAEMAGVRPAR